MGGAWCSIDGVCGAYRWRVQNGHTETFPGFEPRSMNDAGEMVGFQDGRFAKLSSRGKVTLLEPAIRPLDGAFYFIADDGTISFTLYVPQAGLAKGAVVIVGDKATNVGRGVAPDAEPLRSYASGNGWPAGQVIGVEFPLGVDGCPCELFGFYWSQATGNLAVGSDKTIPRAVNRDGWVVGGNTAEPGAFLWSPDRGTVDVNTLVSDLPAGTQITGASLIGDGGHIVANLSDHRLVLLTPQPGQASRP